MQFMTSHLSSHVGVRSVYLGWMVKLFIVIALLLLPLTTFADQQSIPLLVAKQTSAGTAYSLSLKIVVIMTLLTVLPALFITMTAFTRIVVVLAILRQGLGIPNVPSNQIVIGLSLIMTVFVMMPIFQKINTVGVQPYIQGTLSEEQALDNSGLVLKEFMLKQTRKVDLKMFENLAKKRFNNTTTGDSMLVLAPAFITSELKTAFEIGFLILLPFLIIDLVVASILMSMGMMMLSPMVISLPFKILFFVLVDGWSLIVTSLVTSFR